MNTIAAYYLLIWIYTGSGKTITTIPYNSYKECISAKNEVVLTETISAICIKGSN